MPAVVGVHGIAQQYGGARQLESVWYDALRDGLAAAGRRAIADALPAADLRVAYFGDLFRPQGSMAADDPHYTTAQLERGMERDLLTEFYQAAIEQEPSLGPPEGAMGPAMAGVQVMLRQLLRSRTFAMASERALIGNLVQVAKFLTDADIKERVLDRVHAEFAGSPRILIGHSLGSVVAYEYLCRYRPPSVQLLVTLGSPLGIPNLIFERLTPAPVGGKGAWPGSVARWINVADADDIVALRKRLAGLFQGSSPDTSVDDRQVDNGLRPHAVDRYLNAKQTGSAIGDAIG